ncbi:MAG TPA: hydrogenase maturation nickel metallochaperone HypA [Hyphomicrobiaceae bacterium]|nr:hydrogenase maturation nickel metallochaperone HypA [Hyphomicrobiaceae bacterium]
MHEMALCESIRTTLEEQSRLHGFTKVARVSLEVGPLSGVEIDALRFGFDVVMRGSVAQAAQLDIIECPAQAWCMACSQTVPIKARFDPCVKCGSYQLQVTGGEELRIKELEVE